MTNSLTPPVLTSPVPTTADAVAHLQHLARDLKVEVWPVDRLKPNPRNARKHSDRQLAQLAASIRQFGFTTPIVADEGGGVLAGHGRLEAARRLGLFEVPVIQLQHLDGPQKRALALADNRIAELSGWDDDLLRLELEELSVLELAFDVEITGFDTVDLDKLLTPAAPALKHDPADKIPDVAAEAISRVGDVWILGPHRLTCGSALEAASYKAVCYGELAQMVFTDPPFNVKVSGHVTGTDRHREFVMASGEMSTGEFTSFLATAAAEMAAHSADGSIHFVCMDWRHIGELLASMTPIYGQPKNLCVWTKTNGGMGSFYRSQHELVFVFKKGEAPHINNFGLGERGRYRTNVWNYPGVNAFGRSRDAELAMHPTVKPVALVADAIKDCSKRNGIVLDPFGGSGTTLIAADKTRRRARLIELDPLYCDVIVRRWQEFTGATAVLAGSDASFDAVRAQRLPKDLRGSSDGSPPRSAFDPGSVGTAS